VGSAEWLSSRFARVRVRGGPELPSQEDARLALYDATIQDWCQRPGRKRAPDGPDHKIRKSWRFLRESCRKLIANPEPV
jgi:hypothetical protein